MLRIIHILSFALYHLKYEVKEDAYNLNVIDNIIFNLIQRDEKIDDEKFITMINFLDEKIDGCKNFLYLLMGHYCVKNLVKFNNLENLHLLNSIMNINRYLTNDANNKNTNLIQSQNQEKNSDKMSSNKSFSQNSHTYDNQNSYNIGF